MSSALFDPRLCPLRSFILNNKLNVGQEEQYENCSKRTHTMLDAGRLMRVKNGVLYVAESMYLQFLEHVVKAIERAEPFYFGEMCLNDKFPLYCDIDLACAGNFMTAPDGLLWNERTFAKLYEVICRVTREMFPIRKSIADEIVDDDRYVLEACASQKLNTPDVGIFETVYGRHLYFPNIVVNRERVHYWRRTLIEEIDKKCYRPEDNEAPTDERFLPMPINENGWDDVIDFSVYRNENSCLRMIGAFKAISCPLRKTNQNNEYCTDRCSECRGRGFLNKGRPYRITRILWLKNASDHVELMQAHLKDTKWQVEQTSLRILSTDIRRQKLSLFNGSTSGIVNEIKKSSKRKHKRKFSLQINNVSGNTDENRVLTYSDPGIRSTNDESNMTYNRSRNVVGWKDALVVDPDRLADNSCPSGEIKISRAVLDFVQDLIWMYYSPACKLSPFTKVTDSTTTEQAAKDRLAGNTKPIVRPSWLFKTINCTLCPLLQTAHNRNQIFFMMNKFQIKLHCYDRECKEKNSRMRDGVNFQYVDRHKYAQKCRWIYKWRPGEYEFVTSLLHGSATYTPNRTIISHSPDMPGETLALNQMTYQDDSDGGREGNDFVRTTMSRHVQEIVNNENIRLSGEYSLESKLQNYRKPVTTLIEDDTAAVCDIVEDEPFVIDESTATTSLSYTDDWNTDDHSDASNEDYRRLVATSKKTPKPLARSLDEATINPIRRRLSKHTRTHTRIRSSTSSYEKTKRSANPRRNNVAIDDSSDDDRARVQSREQIDAHNHDGDSEDERFMRTVIKMNSKHKSSKRKSSNRHRSRNDDDENFDERISPLRKRQRAILQQEDNYLQLQVRREIERQSGIHDSTMRQRDINKEIGKSFS